MGVWSSKLEARSRAGDWKPTYHWTPHSSWVTIEETSTSTTTASILLPLQFQIAFAKWYAYIELRKKIGRCHGCLEAWSIPEKYPIFNLFSRFFDLDQTISSTSAPHMDGMGGMVSHSDYTDVPYERLPCDLLVVSKLSAAVKLELRIKYCVKRALHISHYGYRCRAFPWLVLLIAVRSIFNLQLKPSEVRPSCTPHRTVRSWRKYVSFYTEDIQSKRCQQTIQSKWCCLILTDVSSSITKDTSATSNTLSYAEIYVNT
jgi:hypothetical protein